MFEGVYMKSHRNLRNWFSPLIVKKRPRPERRVLLQLEELETRALLSANSVMPAALMAPANVSVVQPMLTVMPQTNPGSIAGYTPQQIQQAYGVSAISPVNGTSINGAGETIAIVDAYYDPNIVSDVNTFNCQFGLQQFNVSGGPTLKVVATGGGSPSTLPQDSTGGWALETSLDVQWAHAMAPQANILLVEASNQNLSGSGSLLNAVQYAASQPRVVVVSMSWGQNEFSGENSYDSYFQPKSSSNPSGYSNSANVTFVAAAGDSGAASGPIYPATSPYVLAVGGTTLSTTTTSSGATVYGSESAWSGSGGGAASYEGEPSYQYNQTSINSTPNSPDVYNPNTGLYSFSRLTPDVSYNADPNTGYAVYDSIASPAYGISGGWTEVGGTSAGSPQWSAIVALSDQQRGGTSLDTNQVQTTLYNTLSNSTTYAKEFHDITTGSNGYSAGVGYDLASGLGTPQVNNIVPLLAKTTIAAGLPTIQGSGYGGNGSSGGSGSSSAGLSGSSSFSSGSYFAMSGGAKPGGGLYTGSGSVNIGSGSTGVGNPSGQMAGNPVAPVTALPAVLNATMIGTPTNGNANALVAFTLSASATPTVPTGSSALAVGVSNTSMTQADIVFGASGLTGPPDSWRLSSLGLNGPQVEQLAAELAGFSAENGNDSSVKDDTGQLADDAAGDLSALDSTTPVLLEADAVGGGDF